MTQAQQPEALRIAMHLRSRAQISSTPGNLDTLSASAANELERQHARILELEQGKCLHHIAEPAAQSEGEAFQALSELTNALRERHYGRMPAEVQAAYDKAWTIVFTGEKSAPAAPQAVQPAIMPKGESAAAQLRAMATNYPAGHNWDKLDARACIRGALEIEALRALLAAAPAHPAEGVPAQVHSALADARAVLLSINRGDSQRIKVGDDVCYWQRDEWVQWAIKEVLPLVEAALAATQPAAQGLDAEMLNFINDKRVALTPEYDGPWKAEVFADEAEPVITTEGNTVRDAVNAALAAQAKQGGAA